MANTVDIKYLVKGSKSIVISIFLRSDGVTGELTKYTLIDPVVDLGLTRKARLSLQSVEHSLAGFDSILEFDGGGIDPKFKWVLAEGVNHPADFRSVGGIVDDSGIDGTGKFQISTFGFNSTQDFGSLIVSLRVVK